MEILFLGVASTEDAINESNRKYYNNKGQVRPQQYFDFSLVEGLSKECSVTAISNPPVATFPKSACLFYYRKPELISDSLRIKYIPLLNLPVIKTFMIVLYIIWIVSKFYVLNRNNNPVILLGYLTIYIAVPALILAKLFRVKITVVVPDVPKYISSYSNNLSSLRKKIAKFIIKLQSYIEYRFDGYIFLTKEMNKLINKKNRPFIVIEGMIRNEDFDFNKVEKIQDKRIIMYAGTLHVKFGIKKLVDAFILSNVENCELWVFGDGDFKEELIRISKEIPSIKYKGTLPRRKVLEIEKKVTFLVNPRPSSEEFTKYSFPSKTLEYMASGTPLITTKLKGIPEEYFNYVFTFNNETTEGMAQTIAEILSYTAEEISKFGKRAKKFVLKEKNNITQSKRIYSFIINNII